MSMVGLGAAQLTQVDEDKVAELFICHFNLLR